MIVTNFGDMVEAFLSSEVEENGFLRTLVSVGMSMLASEAAGKVGKKVLSKVKAKNLKAMKNGAARDVLEEIGLKRKLIKSSKKI